jgi:hypothetical protein
MDRIALVVHERRGVWVRQLRPRVADWPVTLIETRGPDDLAAALGASPYSILIADLGGSPRAILHDIGLSRRVDHHCLALVLDPQRHEGAATLARELGATLVIAGFCPPPRVVAILERWLRLCRARRRQAGWVADTVDEIEW